MKIYKNLMVIIILFVCLPVVCFAQQEISGPQSGTLGPGNYNVVGDIQVDIGESLSIVPGTIFSHTGNYKWEIYGTFTAIGAENDSIFFIREGNDGWGALRFMNNAPAAVLNYCVVDNCYLDYSDDYVAGVNVTGGMGLTLTHSRVSNCYSWNNSSGVYVSGSVAFIDSCKILNNVVVNHLKGAGIYLKDCADSQILNSTIAYNHSDGGG